MGGVSTSRRTTRNTNKNKPMKKLHPLLRINELGTARRRRLIEKMLRWLRINRHTAAHLATKFIR